VDSWSYNTTRGPSPGEVRGSGGGLSRHGSGWEGCGGPGGIVDLGSKYSIQAVEQGVSAS